MELRSNQVEPVRIGIEFFQQKKADPSIIVAPTAFGKSVLIAKIAESVKDNFLILQPSKELLEQNFAKYTALGGYARIYSASFGSKRIGQVTFATIGSIVKMGKRFKEEGFTKMCIDECHLYPRDADSMLGKFLKDSEISKTLGLTATPFKLQSNIDQFGNPFSKLVMLTSRSKMGSFYKEIISVSQISDIVKLGYWSKLEYEQYDIDETGLRYNSTKAEFTEESLKKVYESNDIHGKIIQKIEDLTDRKSILTFVPSIDEAMALAKRVPNSLAVYSGMPARERSRAVDGFKSLRIRNIFNVNILGVGFDHPQLDGLIDGNQTASLARQYQKIGRLTRIHELKKDGLVVDFSGNTKRFGKIENLHFEKEGNTWKLYGENDNLLTGIPIHEIGMYKKTPQALKEQIAAAGDEIWPYGIHRGTPVSQLPKRYREWALANFNFNEGNMKYKTAMEKVR